MAGIVVRPRARILHGHDWVFSSEVLKVFGDPADGDVISIKDGRDRMLGSAIGTRSRRSWRAVFRTGDRSSIWISSSDESRRRRNTAPAGE
jgi:hypothetical protein